MVAVRVVPLEVRPVALIGVPLLPVPAWVNQISLPLESKPVPVTVMVLPFTDTPVILGLVPEIAP